MPAIADVRAEDPGRAAVGPRVRQAGVEDRVARAAALGVGADRDPGHGHDRLDVGLVHAVDDDRRRRGGRRARASNARSAGSRVRAPADLRERPARSSPGGSRAYEIRIPSQPGSGGDVLPAGDARSHLGQVADRGRSRVGAGPRRTRRRRAPGARAGGSSRGSSRRPCTGTGRRRRRGRRRGPRSRRADRLAGATPDRLRAALEVRDLQAAARPGRRTVAIASSSAANSPSASLRMWVAYSPPRAAAAARARRARRRRRASRARR